MNFILIVQCSQSSIHSICWDGQMIPVLVWQQPYIILLWVSLTALGTKEYIFPKFYKIFFIGHCLNKEWWCWLSQAKCNHSYTEEQNKQKKLRTVNMGSKQGNKMLYSLHMSRRRKPNGNRSWTEIQDVEYKVPNAMYKLYSDVLSMIISLKHNHSLDNFLTFLL